MLMTIDWSISIDIEHGDQSDSVIYLIDIEYDNGKKYLSVKKNYKQLQ